MKSFIRAITIIIVLALIPATSATAQITPAPAPIPAPAPAPIAPVLGSDDAIVQLRTLLGRTNQQSDGVKVLVIPTAEIKPQDMVHLMEDMTVMCRIFDKKMEQSNLVPEMSLIGRVRLLSSPFSRGQSMGAMYVQGYGALFTRTVDFPLSPPPQTEEQEEAEEDDADPVWEQMKQEMFSPQVVTRRTSGSQEKYDVRKVKNLKSTLIKALVHTANIRGLKSNELVVLTVIGKADWSDPLVTRVYSSGDSKYISTATGDAKTGTLLPTVLTIRAKKSYIDALAQKQIDFDKFEEKIQLLSYPCLGQNVGGKSSPSILPGTTTGYYPYGSSSTGRRSSGR